MAHKANDNTLHDALEREDVEAQEPTDEPGVP